MKQLVVVRGVPGAGKSTWVRSEYPDALVISADQLRSSADGYKYDPKENRAAKAASEALLAKALELGYPVVVLDNTHMTLGSFEGAMQMALRHGYHPRIVRVLGAFSSRHGVPAEVTQRMAGQYEPHPLEEAVYPTLGAVG